MYQSLANYYQLAEGSAEAGFTQMKFDIDFMATEAVRDVWNRSLSLTQINRTHLFANVYYWVRTRADRAQHVASICTGSLVLAAAGLLRGRRATTHWGALDLLERIDATIQVDRDQRVVGDDILTSAGVSAGIDMAFSLVERICGRAIAEETAHYIEYPWPRPGASGLIPVLSG